MTTQDWIGILWLIAITILYAYAYHIRTQHIRHKEHKENSRQIYKTSSKQKNTKKNNHDPPHQHKIPDQHPNRPTNQKSHKTIRTTTNRNIHTSTRRNPTQTAKIPFKPTTQTTLETKTTETTNHRRRNTRIQKRTQNTTNQTPTKNNTTKQPHTTIIHLKPLTHHGPQTHKTHKQGYLKWHYHPNTQDTNATQATQTYQHIKDHEPQHTTQWDNNQLHTFPQELDNQLQKEYKTHIPTPTGPITHTHNPTNNTYQITDGTETITINAQQILKQAAKHTNDKNILKHLLKTLKHIQQDLQQHGPHQGLLHPNDRTP